MSAIRMLMPFELDKYRDHLLRLGANDRRLRFGTPASDARIEAFADGIDLHQTCVLAQLDANLDVMGAVQISLLSRRAVELAFSVDPAYRRAGLGTEMMNRALLWSRNRRRSNAHVHCLAENIAMRRLVAAAGMEMTTAGGETEAVMVLSAATPLSHAAEAFAEGAGLADLATKINRRARARMNTPAVDGPPLRQIC